MDKAAQLFGDPERGWLDLSTGVNPNAYADTQVSTASFERLPQANLIGGLLDAARRYYQVPELTSIIAAPGSQAVLQALPTLSSGRDVAVVEPTYDEHATTWADCGHRVAGAADLLSAAAADVIVLVNPNNPDGRVYSPVEIVAAAKGLRGPERLFVVDEAFADVAPDMSVIPLLGNASIVAVRSFGKFFGLPGLRLGFAAGPPHLIEPLQRRLGPWAVSGPAIEVGTRALADEAWAGQTRTGIREMAQRLDAVLGRSGLRVIGGTGLFRLIDDPDAAAVFEKLGRAGIFVRRFPCNRHWLRFGLPGTEAGLERLAEALS